MNIQHTQPKVATTYSVYQTTLTAQEKKEDNSPIKKEHVTISKESLTKFNASLTLRTESNDDILIQNFQKSIEEYNNPEAIEQRRLEQLEKEQAYNPLTDEFNLLVKGDFPENTLHHTISEVLKGKVVNEWVYAAELADSIRSSVSMRDKSAEERAAYREMALKQAEYIAENYFDNDEEKTAFMDEINKYYENDLLREKGYVVFDNSNLKPFKQYSSPRDGGEVSYMTFAKEYMEADHFERWINNEGTIEETTKFLRQLENNKDKWSKAITNKLEINAQQVKEAIVDVKEMFESFVWEDGRVTETGEERPDFFDKLIKWNEDMLNLFH